MASRLKSEVTALDVAAHLHTTARIVSVAIETGKLPIGFVDTSGKTRRTVIIPERWEAYLRADDLKYGGVVVKETT
jgi:hypothetical protein